VKPIEDRQGPVRASQRASGLFPKAALAPSKWLAYHRAMRDFAVCSTSSAIMVSLCLGCGSGLPRPSRLGKGRAAPEAANCVTTTLPMNPNLMGWHKQSRANLASRVRQGLVAVRYSKGGGKVELEVIDDCTGSSTQYQFIPHLIKDKLTVDDIGELEAKLPLGSADLGEGLNGSQLLRFDYEVVGQLHFPVGAVVKVSNFAEPGCSRATHVVTDLHVGGFALIGGEPEQLSVIGDAFLPEAGEQNDVRRRRVLSDGAPDACERSRICGKLEPSCDVPLWVTLLPLEKISSLSCRAGTKWNGEQCAGPSPGSGEMVGIPSGTFMMGSDESEANEKPTHLVTVAAFEMDRTEVTVAAYQACVNAGPCVPVDGEDCNAVEDKANHPINCMSWYQAETFCAWAGKRLPTEEEWEYAARGADGRKYPWGNTPEPSDQLCWSRWEGTCPVGSFPSGSSPFGIQDMAGNVWEWTSSGYSEDYQKTRSTEWFVVRGGGYIASPANDFRTACRGWMEPSGWTSLDGFRCAR